MAKQKKDFSMRKDIRKLIERDRNPIWRRIFAYIVDVLIIQIIVELIFYNKLKQYLPSRLSFREYYTNISSNPELASFFVIIGVVASFLAIIYFTLLELKYGQTIGKMLFKIRTFSSIDKKMTLKQAFIRNLSKAIFFINYLSIIFIIDLFFLIFSGKRLFEKLSKTYVSRI